MKVSCKNYRMDEYICDGGEHPATGRIIVSEAQYTMLNGTYLTYRGDDQKEMVADFKAKEREYIRNH